MLPLLPFAAGLLTGAVALKLWRNDKTKAGIDAAGEKIRAATVSGLTHLEASTARARERLSPPSVAEVAPPQTRSRKAAPAKTAEAAGATAKKAPRRRKSATATPSTGELS